MSGKKLFEIYLYSDQTRKSGHGGHVRFVAAEDLNQASHRVAFVWGHWWRTCGIREVDTEYWRETHSTLAAGKSAHQFSLEAYSELTDSFHRSEI